MLLIQKATSKEDEREKKMENKKIMVMYTKLRETEKRNLLINGMMKKQTYYNLQLFYIEKQS